uniref:uncharacterized protein isoform X2 n=1 Tax=Centroberyx gerrardi TaxID=166262 RepID=UPI003AADED4D
MHSHQWSRRSFLSVCLTAASLLLLLPLSGAEVQYEDYLDSTLAPDYSDYNATFDYSFYSNSSIDDLDEFLKGAGGGADPEDEGGEEGQEGTVTVATSTATTTEGGRVPIYNTASLPGTRASGTVGCSFLLLLSLTVQLEHTL